MEDPNVQELFNQHGVCMRALPDQANGILYINDYPNIGRCVEWQPFKVSLVMESSPQHPEWALVETIGQAANYNLSSSPVSEKKSSFQQSSIKIPFYDLKHFTVNKKGLEIVFTLQDGTKYLAFFQQSHGGNFVAALRSFASLSRSKKDPNKYKFINDTQTSEALDQSFSELNLFGESKTDAAWKFIEGIHHRPYETTMQAFSKVTDFFLYRSDPASSSVQVDYPAELLPPLSEESRVFDEKRTMETYEVIGQVTALPARVVKKRDNPLDLHRLALLQDENGKFTDVEQVKDIIFRGGIENSLRSEVWKFLLCMYPWDSTCQERQEIRMKKSDEYYKMKLQWLSMTDDQEKRFSHYHDRKSLIEKDVNRTDRNLPFYSGDDNKNLKMLNDVLMTYCMYNFDLGYVQGMNDLLSPILVIMNNEVDSFWCFAGFMEIVGKHFAFDQVYMKSQLGLLFNLLSAVEPELANYIDQNESGNMYFCFRWLLVVFKREYEYSDVMRLWEVLWTAKPCPNYYLLMAVAMLDSQKATIIDNRYSFTGILKHINEMSMSFDLESTLSNAEAIYEQLRSAINLANPIREIIGLPLLSSTASPSKASTPTEDDDEYVSSSGMVTLSSSGEASYESSISLAYL